jgi:hypothetical protein
LNYRKRKDGNQSSIAQALARVGASFIDTTKDPTLGFDGLILYRGRVFIAELKNPEQPASARQLTDGEQKRKQQCEAHGVAYNVIEDVNAALRLIGAIK